MIITRQYDMMISTKTNEKSIFMRGKLAKYPYFILIVEYAWLNNNNKPLTPLFVSAHTYPVTCPSNGLGHKRKDLVHISVMTKKGSSPVCVSIETRQNDYIYSSKENIQYRSLQYHININMKSPFWSAKV